MLDKILALIFGCIMLFCLLLPFLLIALAIILIIYSLFTGKQEGPPDVYSSSDIEEYMKNNEMVNYIENENIFISISDYDEGMYIRCVNKQNQKEFFTVTGTKEMLGTCWAVVQEYSYFNKYTYKGLFYWFNTRYVYSKGELFLTKNK